MDKFSTVQFISSTLAELDINLQLFENEITLNVNVKGVSIFHCVLHSQHDHSMLSLLPVIHLLMHVTIHGYVVYIMINSNFKHDYCRDR